MNNEGTHFQIAIIGSGPIGIDCALTALHHGYRFVLFESACDIAENVRSWSHVRLFTPLEMNISETGRSLVKRDFDDQSFLTGQEYIDLYLRPACHLFWSNIRLNHRVISVGRSKENRFILFLENGSHLAEEYYFADCVIDASGTFSLPNFTGAAYLPAVNERKLLSKSPSVIRSAIVHVDDPSLRGKRILLLGKGYSAATSAIALAKLKENYPETELFWIIKQKIDQDPYCVHLDDPLEQRRLLTECVNEIYRDKKSFKKIYTNSVVKKYQWSDSKSSVDVLIDVDGQEELLSDIDVVISNTGSKPNRDLYSNLNVHECYRTKGPMALAIKLLGSSGQDCLKQSSHGPQSMLTTEKNFFIVGNKSYGRQTNFLLKIGFQQVRDVFQLIEENFNSSLQI